MSESLISIIIPVLDGSKFLVRCFDTLEKQLYSNLEVIFIDNGSEDDSKEIIKNQCSKKKNYYLIKFSFVNSSTRQIQLNHSVEKIYFW